MVTGTIMWIDSKSLVQRDKGCNKLVLEANWKPGYQLVFLIISCFTCNFETIESLGILNVVWILYQLSSRWHWSRGWDCAHAIYAISRLERNPRILECATQSRDCADSQIVWNRYMYVYYIPVQFSSWSYSAWWVVKYFLWSNQHTACAVRTLLEAYWKTCILPKHFASPSLNLRLAGFQLLSPSMNNSAINIDPHSLDRYFGPKAVHVGKVLLHDEWWPQFVLKSLTLCRSFRQYLGVSPRGMVWMWSIWIWSTEPIVSVLSSTRARLQWAWIPRPCNNLQDMHNTCVSPGQKLLQVLITSQHSKHFTTRYLLRGGAHTCKYLVDTSHVMTKLNYVTV